MNMRTTTKRSLLFKRILDLGITLSITCVMISTHLQALPNDRNQPIIFQSDEAEHNELKGTLTYSGTVIMEQGSMKITADKVVVFGNKDKISKIEAIGSPARFSQLPSIEEQPVNAEANLLEYMILNDSLHLVGNAALIQSGSSLSGNRIDYDVKKSIVKAGGTNATTDANGNIKTKKKRVKMIIPPRAFNINDSDSTTLKK